ncbi:MAG: hypothetical protein JXD23_03705 [Spirochaetales bacterium]|nr:hypothetical protein [Spirochaetales bacterium]
MTNTTRYFLVLVWLLFALPLGAQEIAPVSGLPAWESAGGALPGAITSGTSVRWHLTANTQGNDKPGVTIDGVARVVAVNGRPIKLEATAERGNPIIIVGDLPFDPSEIPPGTEAGENMFMPLPGRPVAYTLGEGGKAAIELTPDRDGYFYVWVRLMNGTAMSIEELKAEMSGAGEEGLTEFYRNLAGIFGSRLVGAWSGMLVRSPESDDAGCVYGRVTLAASVGQAGAAPPDRGLYEKEMGLPSAPTPPGPAVASLSGRGRALLEIERLAAAGADAEGILRYVALALTVKALHPALKTELVRYAVRTRLQGQTISGIDELLAGADRKALLGVTGNRSAAALFGMLSDLKSTSLALVAADGRILAATGVPAKLYLDKEAEWPALREAEAGPLLVASPRPSFSAGFLTRRAAAPVYRDAAGTELLGWLLCDFYAGPATADVGSGAAGKIKHPSPIEAGALVRLALSCGSAKLTGTVDGWQRDLVVLNGQPIPFGLLTGIEVNHGTGSYWLAGGLIGIVVGAAAGGLIAAPPVPFNSYGDAEWGQLALGMAIGGVGGAVVGAIIGSFIHYDGWDKVPLESFEITP